MKGFELKFLDKSTGKAFYISNLPKSGAISLIVADNKPSTLDLTEVFWRTDVPINTFGKLLGRIQRKMITMEEGEAVERYEIIETPEDFRWSEIERRNGLR